MPKSTEGFNRELEGFLRSQGFHKIATLDSEGNPVPDAGEADQFKFHYVNGENDYGTVTITTHDGRVTVYYNESVVKDPEKSMDTGWTKFLAKLKDWSLRNGQMGFSIMNMDNLGVELRKRHNQKREEKLLEGWYGNKHTSYNDGTPSIKMIIKHNKTLDEDDQRYHHIEKIFLETGDGERILVPSRKPSIGRVFARHLAEGGQYNDDRWKHIKELSEDLNKLSGFIRATRNGQFNEGAEMVVEQVVEHYNTLKGTVKRLQGSRGYNLYFESWQPSLMEENGEGADYTSYFSASRIDPRIENALPILSKLNINITKISEADEFAEWADNIVEGRSPELDKHIEDLVELLGKDNIPVGPDASSIKGMLDEIIPDTYEREELFADLEDSAEADPDNNAKPVILSWLQENRDEEFSGAVLDKLESGAPEETPPPPAKAAEKPAPKATSSGSSEKIKSLMPEPMSEGDEIFLRIKKLSGLK